MAQKRVISEHENIRLNSHYLENYLRANTVSRSPSQQEMRFSSRASLFTLSRHTR